jgi:hypothetical protein
LRDLDSKLEANKAFDFSAIKSDLKDWEIIMNKLYYDKDLVKELSDKSAGYSKSINNSIEELKNEIFHY